ncbi:hypothetical protein D3C80_824440 [compost metagenome]
MAADVDLAFDARYPAEHCIGGLIDAVEQAQDRQGHGDDDARQHADPEHADGGQHAQPEFEAAEAVDFLQRLHIDQAPAGHQQHRAEGGLGNPGHGRGEGEQDQGDDQGGDNPHQLAFTTDHVVDRGA